MEAEIDLRFDSEPEVVSTASRPGPTRKSFAIWKARERSAGGEFSGYLLGLLRLLHTEPARWDSNLRPSDS